MSFKRFNKVIVNEVEHVGEGQFSRISKGIIIDAGENSITHIFTKMIRNTTVIKHIQFKGENTDSSFAGDFMVTNISGNSITLEKI
ncbi:MULTISPECIES: hypothetical protein [unclassified Oceanobacillus]|uniref:hypothetical protein n=1 Tax=unclassified Oceanobacillus TaxID=2630292 RepID=UPI00300E0779